MIVVRFKVKCKPEKTEQLRAAFEPVVGPSRSVEGVLTFDNPSIHAGRDPAPPTIKNVKVLCRFFKVELNLVH